MKLSQVITHTSLAAVALLNLSVATRATAEPIVVTRGPGNAAHVVQSDNVPIDAKRLPNSPPRPFPQLVQRGPGGAFHLTNKSAEPAPARKAIIPPRLIQRGPNGAGFISNK